MVELRASRKIDWRIVGLSILCGVGMLQFSMALQPFLKWVWRRETPVSLLGPAVAFFLVFAFAMRAAFARRFGLCLALLSIGVIGAGALFVHDLMTGDNFYYFCWWKYTPWTPSPPV